MLTKREKELLIKGGIIGAVITAIGSIGAAYVASPLANTQWEERPIIQTSFGALDKSTETYPKQQLQFDGTNYYVEIVEKNLGKSEGSAVYTVTADHARISFDKHGIFSNQASLNFLADPNTNASLSRPPIYVIPDLDTSNFTISLSVQSSPNQPPFEELNLPLIPASLTFKKVGTNYTLVQ